VRRSAALTAVAAAAVLGSSIAALAAGGLGVRVAPHAGAPDTAFRVAFTAPDAAGHQGVFVRSYSVQLTAARGYACTRTMAMDVAKAAKGERVRLVFRARPPWCAGRGHGTIFESSGPYCPRKTDPCPAFPSETRTIARFRFSVR
jgi:hypothetical protein